MKRNILNQIKGLLPLCAVVALAGTVSCTSDLRGWNMGGTAKELYEQGIKVSFDEFAIPADEYAKYLENDKGVSADYTDPYNPGNNIAGLDKATVKWNEGATNEEKLHKIINQKWLAMYPEGQEGWSEFRRTGYPKLFSVVENYSSNVGGGIAKGDFVKRLRFPRNDNNSNAAEVERACFIIEFQF